MLHSTYIHTNRSQKQTFPVKMPLVCWVKNCSKTRDTIQRLLDHLRNGHSIHYNCVEVRCGQEGCPGTFVGFRALKRHLQKQHSHLESDSELALRESVFGVAQPLMSSDDDTQADLRNDDSLLITDDSNVSVCLTSSCMQFLSQLQCKANMSMTNVQTVSESIKVLLNDVANYACSRVKRLCRDADINQSNTSAQMCLSDLSQLPDCLTPIETEHKRLKYLVQSGVLIEPQTIDLGHRVETRFSSKLGYNENVIVPNTMQYIPMHKLLAAVLNDPYYKSALDAFAAMRKDRDPEIISHFFDTDTYQKHPFFCAHPDALALHIFVDGFEVTNPLGSHTAVHKMEGLYMVIQNFPTEIQSKLSSVFLVALWHAHDVKKYGYDKILRPVVIALQELESDEGVMVNNGGSDVTVRAALVLVSADNLGFNSLFGFCESFTATRFCRFCESTRDEADVTYDDVNMALRSKTTYDMAVAAASSSVYDARQTGIKRGCLLNDLKYFHVTANFVVDGMHDVLEGIAPFQIGLILVELSSRGYLTVEDLNRSITFFNYSLADKNSRPPTLTALHCLKMSASEMWCFMRNLPLMIGVCVPRGDKYWKLLLMLLDIVDITFAPRITIPLSSYLRRLIDDHHSYFKELFPDKRLLPKHHFLVHYPRCLVASGPPVRYWCMRFEARHKFFKDVASQSHCYVNISKTLAKRFQLSVANNFMMHAQEVVHNHYDQIGPSQDVLLCSLDDDSAAVISHALHICKQDNVFLIRWISIGHYTFKPHCVALCAVLDGQPQFGIVTKIVGLQSSIFFVLEMLQTLHFDQHFHAYAVKHYDCPKLECRALKSLKDHIPLQYYHVKYESEEHLFVALRYSLF